MQILRINVTFCRDFSERNTLMFREACGRLNRPPHMCVKTNRNNSSSKKKPGIISEERVNFRIKVTFFGDFEERMTLLGPPIFPSKNTLTKPARRCGGATRNGGTSHPGRIIVSEDQ